VDVDKKDTAEGEPTCRVKLALPSTTDQSRERRRWIAFVRFSIRVASDIPSYSALRYSVR
jgi:hypothetical protein